jgi:WD repeat-containing protein 42A
VSGSDDGHLYVWRRNTCELAAWLPGDRHVVNCLEPHPWLPLTLATSGAPPVPGPGPVRALLEA